MNPYDIINKYYQPDTMAHYILTRHSKCVADRAVKIAKAHPEMNIDIDFVYEAAMLHDIGIFQCHAPSIYCHGTHTYIEHGILGAALLRQEGFPRHALVCEHHTGTGLTPQDITTQKLPIPLADYSPTNIEEILVCYADKFYSKSRLEDEDSVEAVRAKMIRHKADPKRFEEWYNLFEAPKG